MNRLHHHVLKCAVCGRFTKWGIEGRLRGNLACRRCVEKADFARGGGR